MSTIVNSQPLTTDVNWRAHLPTVALLAFCGILFFIGLGERDLTSSHEARAAQNAQTILDEGHWLVPRLFDQHLELQKPPMYYWLVALIGWLKAGTVDAWAVRLPAALSALGCVLFVFYLGKRTGRPLAGFLAALILASSLHFTWLARVGRIDMPLTFAVTVALGSFRLGYRADALRWRWHALGYAALGIGLLLKGPIAVVLAAVVVGTLWTRRLLMAHFGREGEAPAEPAPRLGTPLIAGSGSAGASPSRPAALSRIFGTLWWGVPLMLAIAAPWYVWANIRTGNQLWEVFFWYHNVERGLGGSETLRTHPWWFYVPQCRFDLLPWSLIVPVALYGFVRRRELRDDAAWSGLLWFAAIALFLSCMSFKRADYLLPAYPGMAIFLGVTIDRAAAYRKWLAPGLVAVLITYAISWQVYNIGFANAEENAQPYRVMADEIRAQTSGPVIFFRAESHLLMHHVGQPVGTILEWENLEWWTQRPTPVYFVMPESCAAEWREHLPAGTLHEVLRTRDYAHGRRDRAMVVLRCDGRSP